MVLDVCASSLQQDFAMSKSTAIVVALAKSYMLTFSRSPKSVGSTLWIPCNGTKGPGSPSNSF